MTAITCALLLLGATFASVGTFAFLACATTAPDRETLRLTWLYARYGRLISAPGAALWLATWHSTAPALVLLLLAAGCASTASLITRGAPELMRRAPA